MANIPVFVKNAAGLQFASMEKLEVSVELALDVNTVDCPIFAKNVRVFLFVCTGKFDGIV